MSHCPICESVYRHQIEVDLSSGSSLEDIMAKGYGRFTEDQLKVHAVSHFKVSSGLEEDSIATRLAVREAYALASTCAEYLATLKRVGRTIENQITSVESGDLTVSQALSKSLVDLYLGTGNQIRESVRLLMEAEKDANSADSDSGNVSSIKKLTEAIERSRRVG